jgi:hypothetical protein
MTMIRSAGSSTHIEDRCVSGTTPGGRSLDSRSAMYLQATQLVSDLHRRSSFDLPAMLRALIEGAAESVPGAQYAGITVTQRRLPPETASATHRYPVLLDEIAARCQQGPCLTAAAMQEIVRIDDLLGDDRWPLYRQETLAQTPIRSVLSFGMLREGGTAAALTFYAEQTNAFDDCAVDVGLIFSTHAALVWNMMRRDQQFRAAVISRDVIGQAKGRMMERFNIDASEAFQMLKLMSQDSNTPLAAVARRVVTGDIWPSTE